MNHKISLYKHQSQQKPRVYANLKMIAYKKVYLQYINTTDLSENKLANFIQKYKIPAAEMERILTAGISNNW